MPVDGSGIGSAGWALVRRFQGLVNRGKAHMRSLIAIACMTVAIVTTFAELGAAQDIVVNGSFEILPPWTGWIPHEGLTGGLLLGGITHTGIYSAEFSATRGARDSLEQVLTTVPGATYEISFWLTNPFDGVEDNDISGTWGGTPFFSFVNYPMTPWTEYTFVGQATASQTSLIFTGRDQPAGLYVDDVSVIPIPEPSSLLLLVLGAAVLRMRRLL
jgi:hypothetical protein